MAQQNATDDATEAPIHESIVEELALRYEVDKEALHEHLAVANASWNNLLAELRETHAVVEETDERLIVLAGSSHEVDEMEKHAYGETDINIPDEYGSRANLLQMAHDKQAKRYAYDAFGGEQDAVDAVGTADAVIVNKED